MSECTQDYCRDFLPPSIVEKLEAGAFRQLLRHLEERSDQVQNIDLMTLSGFCRNCLAKWMVVEARKLADEAASGSTAAAAATDLFPIDALNALGYEEAAQHVYGMSYSQWKARHQKKATHEQMDRYKASEPLHAKHDKELLAKRGEQPKTRPLVQDEKVRDNTQQSAGLMSNVCCQDVEEAVTPKQQAPTVGPKDNRTAVGPFEPPPLPKFQQPVRIAVLTISDRAYKNEYSTGDLSGPAVVKAVQQIMSAPQVQLLPTAIVPDDKKAIQEKMLSFSKEVDIILTTGGTGMSPRDVTPEATREVLTTECAGLMSFVAAECSRLQPLASLTRGTAGILGQAVVIANLPGNPKGVGEIMPILLPLLLHAIRDLRP